MSSSAQQADVTGEVAADRPASPTPDGPAVSVPGRWLVLVVVLSAVFMQFLDVTITMVAIPSIQADLGATFADAQLVVALYALAFACVLVTGGRLGDIYGRRRIFLVGMVGFTVASGMCGAATSADFLVWSRVLQGMFSGLMFPQALSIIQVSFSAREKPKALAFYGASIGLATVLGPVLGGWLIELDLAGTDWRSIFYINIPVGLAALILGVLRIRESSSEESLKLDPVGVLILTTGLFLLILPLVIGRDHDWPTWSLVMLAVSPLVLIWFYFFERGRTRAGANPLVPTPLFAERPFTVGLLAMLCFFAGIPSFFMTLFLTLQIGFAYSAVSAGAVTLSFALFIAIASARSAVIVKKLGTFTLSLGTGLLVLGMLGVIYTLNVSGTDLKGWYLIPALMLGGIGTGLFLAPSTGIILAGIKSDNAGAASGTLATTQQVGVAIGIALIGIIFAGQLDVNAEKSFEEVRPGLVADLNEAGLQEQQVERVVTAFQICFYDRTSQRDMSAVPPSCQRLEEQSARAPIPDEQRTLVRQAVLEKAAPEARKDDFSRSFQRSLLWQVGVFGTAFLLVFALPKVKPASVLPGGA